MLNLIKKISLTNKLLVITKMLSIFWIQYLIKTLNKRILNEELEEKGFITIAGRVSRKYYEEKFYGMVQAAN